MLGVGVTVSPIHLLLWDRLKKLMGLHSEAVLWTAIRGCGGRREIKLGGCGKQLLNMTKSFSVALMEGVRHQHCRVLATCQLL